MGTVRYTVINGEVVAEKRNGIRSLYVPDSLGTTRALLDNTQTPTDTFVAWPYGETVHLTGSNPTPFTFVGTQGYHTDNPSRIYVRERVQEPQKARWLTEDPIGELGGLNLFVYASDQPTTQTDPSGQSPCAAAPPAPGPPSGTGDASCYTYNFKNCCTSCGTCFDPCQNYAAMLPGAGGIWNCGDLIRCCKTSDPTKCIEVIIADTGKENRLIDLPCCYAKKVGFMPTPTVIEVTCTRIGHVGLAGAKRCQQSSDCGSPSQRGATCGGKLGKNGKVQKR